ncbi:caspase family protein [Pandoraea norimbergensis]|uniref:Peptidase C14 caspase domain-containing protein n=1 Tax=Pandoraea norimbergensis TaxID=93219 RepID=A0ABN4JI69_9BURK|nr:caspase family protein [Pandoraea norimbergensis]ALS60161.1 hypothetical protein AT302_10675 [Pandoraea norimbergensis]
MAKALVAIGVGQATGGLHYLKGAASDARLMCDWGEKQGFACVLLTDEKSMVRIADVYEAIDAFVECGTYSQIVVYFSGHGVLTSPDCEYWLLSGAPSNPNEAVNVCGSIWNARSTSIEHVVLISDACRSKPASTPALSLSGGVIFPPRSYGACPEVDVFYATLPGDVALELPPSIASARHQGLLTQCLLDALDGKVPDVIEAQTHAGEDVQVVHSRPLKAWLTSTVPTNSALISLHLQQKPDIRVESGPTKYLSKFHAANAPAETAMTAPPCFAPPVSVGPDEARPRRLVPSRASRRTNASGRQFAHPTGKVLALSTPGSMGFESSQKSAAFGPQTASILVRGERVVRATCESGAISPVHRLPGGAWSHLQTVDPTQKRRVNSIAVRFESGVGILLPLLPGYLASVAMKNGAVASIHYSVIAARHANARRLPERRDVAPQLARLSLQARAGMLSTAEVLGVDERRWLTLIQHDPLIAIHAGYAYARSGRHDMLKTLADEVRSSLGFLPFDIAMLAAQQSDEEFPSDGLGMPMLTQGWMMWGRFERNLPHVLRVAQQYLLPSLWTTFRREGMDEVEQFFVRTE